MIIGRPRIATVDVGVPGVAVHGGVAGLVASACARALVDGDCGVLFLDAVEILGGGCHGSGDGDGRLASFSTSLAGLVDCGHGGVEGGELAHHALVLILLVGMDSLGMLTEVVEAGELL